MLVRKIVATGLVVGVACVGHAKVWNLAIDWPTNGSNPNGTWTYGQLTSNPPTLASFVPLTFISDGGYLGSSEYGHSGTPLIYKPASESGITPGQVDLDAIDATPDVRWTSPIRGTVTISVAVGGPTGNSLANKAVLVLGLSTPAGTYNSISNTESWLIPDVAVTPGETLDVYVPDPAPTPNPNTQTLINIAFVTPEPAPFVAVGLGVLGLLIRRRRR